MDGKAEQLGAERLLDMFGIGRIELVLFFEPPMRLFGGRVLAADLVQFGEHDVAETG
jgi:hypothetical protein